MTDILLIQPPIRDFYLTAKRTIPYGLASIAAVLREAGFSVDIFDGLATAKSRIIETPEPMARLHPFYGRPDISPFALFHGYRHYGYSFEHIGKTAAESGAWLIGISSLFTPYSEAAIETAVAVKRFHPKCTVVIGGHHPTALPQAVMEHEAVDYLLRGEGEVSLPALARAIREKRSLEDVPGIVFRKAGPSLHVSAPALMENPDHYPLPAFDLIRNDFYRRKGRGSIVVTASRGCPLKCTYCALGGADIPFRRRSVSSVISEIEAQAGRGDVGFIDFEDENLSLNRRWFMELLSGIMDRFSGSEIELRAMNGLYPPSLDETMVQTMKEAGFKTLNLSLGTISRQQLKRFRRPDVRPGLEKALGLAEKFGMDAVCYIIAAGPGQSAEDSLADLLYLARQRTLAGVSIFYPAPGSRDYEYCREKGLLPADFSLMRGSALPIEDRTSRIEAATLLRLGRITNFMKSIIDTKAPLPSPVPHRGETEMEPGDRMGAGIRLLQWFLSTGEIFGLTPQGEIYAHTVSKELTRKFILNIRSNIGSNNRSDIRGIRGASR